MFRNFIFIGAAVFAGYGLAQFSTRSGAPSWWPDRERDRSVRYFREVRALVDGICRPTAIGSVLRKEGVDHLRKEGTLDGMYAPIIKTLFFLGLVPFGVILFFGLQLFSIVFGVKWAEAGRLWVSEQACQPRMAGEGVRRYDGLTRALGEKSSGRGRRRSATSKHRRVNRKRGRTDHGGRNRRRGAGGITVGEV